MRWCDNHCHVVDPSAVAAAQAAGVERLIVVGTDVESSRTMIEAAGAQAL